MSAQPHTSTYSHTWHSSFPKQSPLTHPPDMDTLLLLQKPSSAMANKRPCPSQNPRIPALNQIDSLLETFLGLSDSPSFSIDLSFERLLESSASDADQAHLIHQALSLGSLLLEAGKRSARKRASSHNSASWALPSDLTIKVFSMLDTQSLCYAAATCSMFSKCAMDPLCYANVDLRTVVPKVNNAVVSTMIQRAGKALQSIKLGVTPGPTTLPGSWPSNAHPTRHSFDAPTFSWHDKRTRQGKESSILTRSCLSPLSLDNNAAGTLLRKLHLYNIERMDNKALYMALSACPSLLDLEIVGLHVELRQTLMSVSTNCHLIERLIFESSKTDRDDSLKSPTSIDLVNNCPHITSLALRGFKLPDSKVRILVKGLRKLRYVDFTASYSITGSFLRNIGSSTGGIQLEVLILRDCIHLKEMEVARLLTAVLAGDFKSLKHIDISNREGLASDGDWDNRCYSSSLIPIKQVLEERPDICLLAEFEFPSEGSLSEIERMIDSEIYNEISLSSSSSSDMPLFLSSSESSYNSDQGSGNEESSDEVDFLTI